MESEDFSSGPRVDPIPQKKLGPRRRRSRKKRRLAERNKAPRVSWQTLWLTDVPLRGRIPRSHACATRHIPLSFTFFPAVSLLLGILSTLTRQQPPLAQRRRASRALSRHFPLPSPLPSVHQLLAAAVAPLPRPPAGFSAPFLLFAFHASSLLLFVFFRRVYTRLRSLLSLSPASPFNDPPELVFQHRTVHCLPLLFSSNLSPPLFLSTYLSLSII